MQGTDVATLSRFVNLPFPPVKVRWETTERPGGNDWSLAALITFQPAQVAELAKLAAAPNPREVQLPTDHIKRWFPPTSKVQASTSDAAMTRVQATVTDGTGFIAPEKSPLVHGQALLFDSEGLVYLSLYTM